MPTLATRLTRLPHDLVVCLGFFSRVPVQVDPGAELRTAVGAWPLAGLVLALGPAFVLVAASGAGMPPLVAATFAVAAMLLVTGALHEDGLADVADGFGGGADKAAKLAIMRDSRIGGYGTLALIVVMLVKVGALSALAGGETTGVLALLGAAVISRGLALSFWQMSGPASPEGLAAAVGGPDTTAMKIGVLTAGLFAIVLVLAYGAAAVFAIVLAGLAVVVFARICRQQIGGHTGDTIGAAQQLAEIVLLSGLSTTSTLAG